MAVYQIATVRTGLLNHTKSNVFTLEYGQEMRIDKQNQTVHVLDGRMWITEEGHDIVLFPGERFQFEQAGYPAIVSSADENVVKFEILD